MKKSVLILSLLVLVAGLSACSASQSQTNTATPTSKTTNKSGETNKSGKIIQAGSSFFLETSDGQRQKLDSYNLDLSAYVNQSVTVTGQFSGDDLFVTSVK
jgi:Protein of unknown function (DUF5818)